MAWGESAGGSDDGQIVRHVADTRFHPDQHFRKLAAAFIRHRSSERHKTFIPDTERHAGKPTARQRERLHPGQRSCQPGGHARRRGGREIECDRQLRTWKLALRVHRLLLATIVVLVHRLELLAGVPALLGLRGLSAADKRGLSTNLTSSDEARADLRRQRTVAGIKLGVRPGRAGAHLRCRRGPR